MEADAKITNHIFFTTSRIIDAELARIRHHSAKSTSSVVSLRQLV